MKYFDIIYRVWDRKINNWIKKKTHRIKAKNKELACNQIYNRHKRTPNKRTIDARILNIQEVG